MVAVEPPSEALARFMELQQLFLEKGKKSKLKEIRTLLNDIKDDVSFILTIKVKTIF